MLRAIGGYHSFSAGLVIGGKNVKEERDRLSRMNILVATPGRLLQHMDQTFGFDTDNLQLLGENISDCGIYGFILTNIRLSVLDEADRILDMGFSRTLNALLSHLPQSRQTLLFSATQTKSVKDLARLSLKDPVSVGVKEQDTEAATPKSLEQHYVLCELPKKLDILWSFIKSHLQSKILVFFSSGKQVRFVFETFRRMHPGIPLLHLHGPQKQATRLGTFSRFTSTSHSVLFATDIAARGLDFPSVDWVVQVDCPEDVETYIQKLGYRVSHDESFDTSMGGSTAARTALVPSLLRYPELRWLDRFDALVPLCLMAGLYVGGEFVGHRWPALETSGAQWVVWGFFIATVVLYHATFTINSLAHRLGSRRYATRDESRNNAWLAVLTFGEGWHNNHHHYPASARQGFYWWELDATWYGLRLLAAIGLIRDLRTVPAVIRDGHRRPAGPVR